MTAVPTLIALKPDEKPGFLAFKDDKRYIFENDKNEN